MLHEFHMYIICMTFKCISYAISLIGILVSLTLFFIKRGGHADDNISGLLLLQEIV